MKYTKLISSPYLSPPGREWTGSDWRPWPIRPPFLASFICLCLIFPLVIEMLVRTTEKHGALVFAEPGTELSLGSICLFNYFPTSITVALNLLWSVPDHHYKRLEPYFQLSKPRGALAEDSLLLDYPYTTTFLIPYQAFKRSHWPVFFSATMSLLISFVVVPLMSGVLEQTNLHLEIRATAFRPDLLSDQIYSNSTLFTYPLYDYMLLNGTMLAFTNETYAILPFVPGTGISMGNETWVGETVLFEADLNCKVAEQTIKANWSEFSNGNDCIVIPDDSTGLCFELNNMMEWFTCFRHPMDPVSNITTSSLCPNNSTFLVAFGGRPFYDRPASNYTALFCETSYWSQFVQATIQMPAGIIQNVERHGARRRFDDFNITDFESVLVNGQMFSRSGDTDHLGNLVRFGYSQSLSPTTLYQLDTKYHQTQGEVLFMLQDASVTGFTIASGSTEELARLVDPVELEKKYNTGLQNFFAFAVSTEIANKNGLLSTNVTRKFEAGVYIANRRWSRLCEAGFGLLAILAICLMISTWGRRCDTDGEPNSIAASLMMIAHSRAFSHHMNRAEFSDQVELREQLTRHAHHYQLRDPKLASSGPRIDIIDKGDTTELEGGDITHLESRRLITEPVLMGPEDNNLTPNRVKASLWLKKPVGVLFFLYFSGLSLFLVFLYYCDKRYNGLPTVASQNSYGYKILFSYLPTIIGMSVHPLWSLLGGYSCMVGPYEALHQGGARSSDTLTLDYDDMPVNFQLIRSYKMKNLILGALTTSILLANFLAIALGGAFSPITILEPVPYNIQSTRIAPNTSDVQYIWELFGNYGQTEMFYVVAGYLSNNSKLPRWTTPEFYILPVDNAETAVGGPFVSRQVATWGLGTDISCQFMPADMISVSRTKVQNTSFDTVHVNHPCLSTEDMYFPVSNMLFESFNPATDLVVPSLKCPGTFAVGWIERPANPQPKGSGSAYLNQIDHVILLCSATLRLAELSVSVSKTDEVLDFEIVSLKNFTYASTNPTNLSTGLESDGDGVGNSWNSFYIEGNVNPLFDFQWILCTQSNPELLQSNWNDTLFIDYVNSLNISYTNQQRLYWMNYLMAIYEPDIERRLANLSYLPEQSLVIKSFEDVYTMVFATYLQLNFDNMFAVDHMLGKQDSIRTPQTRVAISPAMFGVIIGILLFSSFVVCVFYSNPPGRHLVHLPTSIATKCALLYASNILDPVSGIRGRNFRERAEKLDSLGNTYSYGSFIGRDERKHFGVYQDLQTKKTT